MAKQYIPRDNAKKTYMDMNRNRQASTSAAQPKPTVKPRAGQASASTSAPIVTSSTLAPSSVLAVPAITPKPTITPLEPTLQQLIDPLNAKIDALIARTELLGQGLAHLVVLCNTMLNVLQIQTENEVDDLEELAMEENTPTV